MYGDIDISTKINLKGNKTKGFLLMIANGLTFFLFSVFVASSVYLFILNDSFYSSFGLSENRPVVTAVVTIFNALIGIILLLFHFRIRYESDCFFVALYSKNKNKKKMKIKYIFRVSAIYIVVLFRKVTAFVLFCLPAFVLSAVYLYLLNSGITVLVNLIFLCMLAILAVSGIACFLSYSKRDSLALMFFEENPDIKIREAIRNSVCKMNGRCFRYSVLKFRNLPKRLLSVFIFTAVGNITFCKANEINYLYEIMRPNIQLKPSINKSVVFYFRKKPV